MCNEVALDSGFDLSCSGLGPLVGSFERGNGRMGSKNSVNFLIDEQLFVPQMGFSYCVTPRHSKSVCQIAFRSLFHDLLCKCKFQLFFFYLVSENFILQYACPFFISGGDQLHEMTVSKFLAKFPG